VRISVGVPAYNQGQYLAEALDSLLNQTVPPDEIVVSDNHSTDETPTVLRRYEGRVRIIRPPEHLPMTAHWNYVVQNLRGDWFTFLSSDDVAEPHFIEHLSRAARSDTNAVLVRGGWDTISLSGRRTGRCRLWSTSSVTGPPRNFVEQLQAQKVNIAAFLCRRSAWAEVGGFPSSLRLFGDWGLWLRLCTLGSIVSIHRVVAKYRTGYPISKELDRLVDFAHDETVIALEVWPPVANTLNVSARDRKFMLRAARRRLQAHLFHASALGADGDLRGRIAAELGPLSTLTDQVGALNDFVAGKAMTRPASSRRILRGIAVVQVQARSVASSWVRLLAGQTARRR
jgi:glycosyltransferase involved in cell wall biosynthesis